ncbi:hypothetical protein CkaCkLH20_05303 [Colletotrichum karsti]|uniref:Beta/gamma crystallin 'Greek key' domain-containing protein n=1 Tax=Colletotrichum karsti TaxID=1095194 RepID=A0A9P6LLY5_9PEZI|nr:uncharacterized protein CkaCkLH20_05303 [Colletotrichum karsti]KAF9877037.1 hypothetical protein CkaCkLH20_05303 [Colletotrichum karsti]
MFSINLILNILAAQAAVVLAAPVDEAAGSPVLVPRADVSVYMCADSRFRGECITDNIQTGSCFNVRPEMIDRISSIRNNDRGSTQCTWYRERECRGEGYRNQDDSNLGDGNGRFNDAIRSMECRRK